jgi:hypothetical protein
MFSGYYGRSSAPARGTGVIFHSFSFCNHLKNKSNGNEKFMESKYTNWLHFISFSERRKKLL